MTRSAKFLLRILAETGNLSDPHSWTTYRRKKPGGTLFSSRELARCIQFGLVRRTRAMTTAQMTILPNLMANRRRSVSAVFLNNGRFSAEILGRMKESARVQFWSQVDEQNGRAGDFLWQIIRLIRNSLVVWQMATKTLWRNCSRSIATDCGGW